MSNTEAFGNGVPVSASTIIASVVRAVTDDATIERYSRIANRIFIGFGL